MNVKRVSSFLCFLGAVALFSGCEPVPEKKEEAPAPLTLVRADFSQLPDWEEETFEGLVPAFTKSCVRIQKAAPEAKFGALPEAGTYGQWQNLCREFQELTAQGAAPQQVRAFFERGFTPYSVRAGAEPVGLFTGYYEASLRGSRARQGAYQIPLYMRADDLVMVDLGEFREELKGQRIAGRVVSGNLKPYETRAEIVAGEWPHNDKVLVWVDSAVDAFFVQIQGSGIVALDDGGTMRIGYAGQNGHPYYAIGRELIARGALTKENVSMQAIRAWLEAHPQEAVEVMNTNASYVFFKALEGEGPLGGENVALTPERSLAIDRSLLPYGLPLWVDIDPPMEGEGRLTRMMVAQDTGGAIRGPVRGDVFWGYGARAEAMAGPMKSQGRYWALLPRSGGE